MKKLISLFLCITMIISFSACGNAKETAEASDRESSAADKNTDADTKDINEEIEKTATDENASEAQETTNEPTGNGKILVAYFSATHTTESVAEKISADLNADLYEIVPKEPYTDADLNYNDSNSRATVEMNDADIRPEIAGTVENMEQYDTIFLAYPIWWGNAPRIISTFLESYDFSGKTIIPFCTSASSSIDASVSNLKPLAPEADWQEGKRFSASDSDDIIMEWVESLGL